MSGSDERPTFLGGLIATIILVTVFAVWKVID